MSRDASASSPAPRVDAPRAAGPAAEPQTQPSSAGDERPTLRVLTYNVRLGIDLHGVLEVLRQHPADICCIQELNLRPTFGDPVHHGRWLAERLGMRSHSLPIWALRSGFVGIGILVRGDILSHGLLHDRDGVPFAATARVQCGAHRIAVCSLHLQGVLRPLVIGFVRTIPRRIAQARRVVRWIAEQTEPIIVAGDFNTFGWAPEYRIVARRLRDCSRAVGARHHATRPTWHMPLQLDHILVSDDWHIRSCDMIDAAASDHRPLIATLEPRGGA